MSYESTIMAHLATIDYMKERNMRLRKALLSIRDGFDDPAKTAREAIKADDEIINRGPDIKD